MKNAHLWAPLFLHFGHVQVHKGWHLGRVLDLFRGKGEAISRVLPNYNHLSSKICLFLEEVRR